MEYEKEFNSLKDILYPDFDKNYLGFSGENDALQIMKYTPMMMRSNAIMHTIATTIRESSEEIENAIEIIKSWIKGHEVVRVIGAGRALLAASLGSNRLAHAGAIISFIGGMVPMPNSSIGGGIIAVSASGETEHVIAAMKKAKSLNPNIKIIGIAKNSQKAEAFIDSCDCFIGIRNKALPLPTPLFALADEEEMAIAEILDGIIVQAGKELGFTEDTWRKGHEDIGPTGPYSIHDK